MAVLAPSGRILEQKLIDHLVIDHVLGIHQLVEQGKNPLITDLESSHKLLEVDDSVAVLVEKLVHYADLGLACLGDQMVLYYFVEQLVIQGFELELQESPHQVMGFHSCCQDIQ